jgi:hypothetical protein
MPKYKGKDYSYDAKGKSAMKADMMKDAMKGGKRKSKRSAMKSRLMSLNKRKTKGFNDRND